MSSYHLALWNVLSVAYTYFNNEDVTSILLFVSSLKFYISQWLKFLFTNDCSWVAVLELPCLYQFDPAIPLRWTFTLTKVIIQMTNTHTHTRTRTHTHTHVHAHTHTHAHAHARTHARTDTHRHTHVHIFFAGAIFYLYILFSLELRYNSSIP